jgi:MurNAc alpha-1-phosphate uridylyltransferase
MRTPPDAVMLFAAGFGTRMRPLTLDRPKPLVEVAGRPLIDHALALAEGIAPATIVANLHYRADQLEAHLAHRPVTTITEAPDILDTGGGLRHALPLLGTGPIFTLNTDAIWKGPNPLALLRDAWEPDRMDALMCVILVDHAIGYAGAGDFARDEAGRLTRGAGLVYGGAQIMKTDRLASVPEAAFSLNRVWDAMQAEGSLFGCLYPDTWCDVGHPGGIAEAEALLEAGDV